MIWAFRDGLNNQHSWKRKACEVDAHDLELYAINTGEFYEIHCNLARRFVGTAVWINHLIDRVIPRYCREVEPVWATYATALAAAKELAAYYQQHIKELS